MFDLPWTTIIFKFLNFAALIALALYIFKKYFLHDIKEKISDKDKYEADLTHEIITLESSGSNLSDQIIKQEKLCQYLIDKTNQWNAVFQQDLKTQLEHKNKISQQMCDRTERQSQALSQERVMTHVLPQAVNKALENLKQIYRQSEQNTIFVHAIIEHIKKS